MFKHSEQRHMGEYAIGERQGASIRAVELRDVTNFSVG
jgi:hypothetical protein